MKITVIQEPPLPSAQKAIQFAPGDVIVAYMNGRYLKDICYLVLVGGLVAELKTGDTYSTSVITYYNYVKVPNLELLLKGLP